MGPADNIYKEQNSFAIYDEFSISKKAYVGLKLKRFNFQDVSTNLYRAYIFYHPTSYLYFFNYNDFSSNEKFDHISSHSFGFNISDSFLYLEFRYTNGEEALDSQNIRPLEMWNLKLGLKYKKISPFLFLRKNESRFFPEQGHGIGLKWSY